MNKLIIIGASGHGKVVADIAEQNGYKEIFFLDDNENVKECYGYPVIGKSSDSVKYSNCDFFIAIGNSFIREKLYAKIKTIGNITTLIHPRAILAHTVKVGRGTVIVAGAIINSDTTIGEGCIINTGATIGHDNVIGDFSHISAGTHLAGAVNIGHNTWVSVGAVIINNTSVCANCCIGAGAVVVKSIRQPGTYIGIPAKVKRIR
ncbi:MAG TPA: acetyltransferase [Candidatus Avacidaminococcus intestinavium]|uniref:Acetyltransferase n=1 Tax=Candidatus Avacidaminococcus intestinavium TaxID=2840684 RepID=A0A9D1MQR1_9FIRM|nr:acetyltransferase [Candidatus Avacidaminococcus intestinavium]